MVEKAPIRVSYEATNGTRESTVVSELSLGGAFVETQLKSPKVGSLVALEIESGTTKVAIDGRVLSTSPKGFAVGFIDLPNDVASSLHFILATKMPRRGTTLGLGEAEEGVAKYVSEPRLAAVPAPPAPAAPTPAAARAPAPAAAPRAPAPPAAAPPAPATASAAPPPSPAVKVPETDAYGPRHPTPRIMPAAPISQPPQAAYGVPPAPTSSAPAVMVPSPPSSRPHAWPSHPPPSPSFAPPKPAAGGTNALAVAIFVMLTIIAIVAAIAFAR